MIIDQGWLKGKKLVRMVFPLYYLIVLIVDEALYGIVSYVPLIVTIFTLLPIYICDVKISLKAITLWMCVGDDHPMWSLCLVYHSSYDIGCMAIVMRMSMVVLTLCICAAYD